jgi:hypothetical protein
VTKPRNSNPSERAGSPLHETDDAALIRAVQGGNPAAMDRLLMRAQDAAYRFSLLVAALTTSRRDAGRCSSLPPQRESANPRRSDVALRMVRTHPDWPAAARRQPRTWCH